MSLSIATTKILTPQQSALPIAPTKNLKREAYKAKASLIAKKIGQVAKLIFKAAMTIGLYWSNPALFAIGFIIGIAADVTVNTAINKIKNVWKAQSKWVCALGICAAYVSLPVTAGMSAFLWAANIGSTMSINATHRSACVGGTLEKHLVNGNG